jgi:hypothetical protein
MKVTTARAARLPHCTVQRALVALVTALLFTSACADDDRDRGEQRGDHRSEERHPGRHYGRSHAPPRRDYRDESEYRYAAPVYAPPPVYYQPQSSPGISLFLPFDLRR